MSHQSQLPRILPVSWTARSGPLSKTITGVTGAIRVSHACTAFRSGPDQVYAGGRTIRLIIKEFLMIPENRQRYSLAVLRDQAGLHCGGADP